MNKKYKQVSKEIYSLLDDLLYDIKNFRNLSNIFEGIDRQLYLDYIHISEVGNKKIAEAILSDIEW